jgi:hypothetical protein
MKVNPDGSVEFTEMTSVRGALCGAKHARYRWKDEIPQEEIHNHGRWKVRSGWFNVIYMSYNEAQSSEKLSDETKKYYNKFREMLETKPLLTRESDIAVGNQFLDLIIRDLEPHKKKD